MGHATLKPGRSRNEEKFRNVAYGQGPDSVKAETLDAATPTSSVMVGAHGALFARMEKNLQKIYSEPRDRYARIVSSFPWGTFAEESWEELTFVPAPDNKTQGSQSASRLIREALIEEDEDIEPGFLQLLEKGLSILEPYLQAHHIANPEPMFHDSNTFVLDWLQIEGVGLSIDLHADGRGVFSFVDSRSDTSYRGEGDFSDKSFWTVIFGILISVYSK